MDIKELVSGAIQRVDAAERPDAEQAWSKLSASIVDVSSIRRDRITPWLWATIACVIIAVTGIKFVSFTSTPQTKTYTTANSQRATITLSDGSTVILAPATTIQVTDRTIDLTGEALFTVSHKNSQPFTIRTGSTVTKVLGTMFSVRRYADDKQTLVAVAEGKVAVQNTILTNGDIAIADNSVTIQHDAERVLALLAFAQGRLTIDDEQLSYAAPQLSRWLDLDIHFDSAAAIRRLSTVLQNETPTQALDDIARLTRTRYVRMGRVVTFSSN